MEEGDLTAFAGRGRMRSAFSGALLDHERDAERERWIGGVDVRLVALRLGGFHRCQGLRQIHHRLTKRLDPLVVDGLHLAVVGSSEGEATLLARWVRDRRADLEQMLGLRAVSLTWLASDIVPAGCLSYAALQAVPVLSQQWIIIATEHRLAHCEVTGHLIETMRALGRPYGELAVDRPQQNFQWYAPREITGPPDNLAECAMVEGLLRVHRGGLYRGALLPYLLAPGAGARQ